MKTSKEKTMCKKLSEIYQKKPEEFLVNVKIPIDIFKILDDKKIFVSDVDFNKLSLNRLFNKSEITGMACAHRDDLYLYYSSKTNADLKNIRFSIAHELAHCCLHMGKEASYHIEMRTKKDILDLQEDKLKSIDLIKEEEADKFARDLLIPTNLLITFLRKKKKTTLAELSSIFCVPASEMVKKLREVVGGCK